MHTHTIVEIMVVAFSNRLNHIFISGMVYPCFSFKRLELYRMEDILFTNDIYMDLFLMKNLSGINIITIILNVINV